MSVQSSDDAPLTEDRARELLAPFGAMKPETLANMPGQIISGIFEALRCLPALEVASWLRGRKVHLLRALNDSPTAARSQVYQHQRAVRLMVVLHQRNLIDMDRGYRDVATGRKVKSLLYELGRLDWADDEVMVSSYLNLRDLPLAQAKEIVRLHNPRSIQSLNAPKGADS